jgi:C4-dicarboxylate-specific signal transduction histidine kinase
MSNNGWTIRVAVPMEKPIRFLQDDYSQKLLATFMISVAALFLIPFVPRKLSSLINGLTLATDMFTSSIERVDVIWPKLNIKEVNSFFGQLQRFVQAINEKHLLLNKVRVEQYREDKEAAALIIQASKLVTLGKMATSVAHELNQPLNVVRMAARNSRRKISKGIADSKYLRGKMERIEAQTARASVIIHHMRMFGREANDFSELIDPQNVTENAFGLMGEQLRLADIELAMYLFQGCSTVLGHSIQMKPIILNLMTNANDAIADKEEKSEITLCVFENDKSVYITLEYKGRGTPKDALPCIFESFYTTKVVGKDRDLGLSISYSIIRKMNDIIVA